MYIEKQIRTSPVQVYVYFNYEREKKIKRTLDDLGLNNLGNISVSPGCTAFYSTPSSGIVEIKGLC